MTQTLKVAFVINPWAGIGGSVALKGSDGAETVSEAIARGAKPLAQQRASQALSLLLEHQEKLKLLTASHQMGESLAKEMGFSCDVVYNAQSPTTPEDTQNFVKQVLQYQPDILLFAGGDGTARDVCAVVPESLPVLGIPAGCKIHSGVYAVTPIAAGRLILNMMEGELLSLVEANVMDIDEAAFRKGTVRAKRYGEMTIPDDLRYVQSVKSGGKESDELVLSDIAAEVEDCLEDELAIMGSGSTVASVMEHLNLPNTLLGVDLIQSGELLASDLTAPQLLQQVPEQQTTKMVITLIGGQGHLFGRGNQQLSPELIRRVERENILVLASKSKLKSLNGRPLIADTGDPHLDQELSGYIRVITGYRDYVMYPIASPN